LRSGLRDDETKPLAVEQIDKLKAVVQIDAAHIESQLDAPLDNQLEVMEMVKRNCDAVVELDELPSESLAKVREKALAEEPSYISAEAKVVADQRRIAMLLFRK